MSVNPEIDGSENSTGIPQHIESSSTVISKSANNGGRTAAVTNYTHIEHEKLLDIIESVPDAYESSQGSATWMQVHTRLNSPRSKEVVHGHFTEMKSAIGAAISTLSSQTPSVKVPTESAENPEYYRQVFLELSKGKNVNKTYQSSKWWNQAVVSKLICLHFMYLQRNGTSQVQTVKSLNELAAESKRKFEQDQHNKEELMKLKREKTEQSEILLAKQRAESLQSQLDTGASLRLMAEGMVNFMTPPGAAGNPQRAEDIIEISGRVVEISGRVTSLADTMKSGFEEIKALMLMQMQRPPAAIEVSFLFHRIMLKY
jgi:hypothetical protein